MTTGIQAASPLIILGLSVAGLLILLTVHRSPRSASFFCGFGLVAALAAIPWATQSSSVALGSLFLFDQLSLGMTALILAASLAVLVIAHGYWRPTDAMPLEEFPLLLLLATLGAVAMAGSIHFVSLFLGLETMTLGTIGMIAYPRFRPEAEEAGLKYLVLSGMSSGFLLFGIALVDLASGSLRLLPSLGAAGLAPTDHQMMLTGITLIVVGAGFKLSVVPFHIWVPDVYAGAPAPSGAYLAVVSKIAVIAVIMRLLAAVGSTPPEGMVLAVTVIAALSMLAGNLLALLQENLKRILGYSSIAHFGYLLVALLATDTIGRKAVLFYLVTYSITVIAAFGGVAVLSRGDRPRDLDQVEDLRGLFWSRPALATVMTLALLSLAGIPPAIGFVAKMYILAAAVHTELWLLTSVMVVGSVVGLFYYLRIIIVMAQPPAVGFAAPQALPVPGGIAIACLTIPLVLFGIAPEPLMEVLKAMLG